MGSNSTFFFQPGVPTRNNPLTPERNYELTHKIAEYHAKYLNKIGSDYFSEEQFDDYYIGKGSSYPTLIQVLEFYLNRQVLEAESEKLRMV